MNQCLGPFKLLVRRTHLHVTPLHQHQHPLHLAVTLLWRPCIAIFLWAADLELRWVATLVDKSTFPTSATVRWPRRSAPWVSAAAAPRFVLSTWSAASSS